MATLLLSALGTLVGGPLGGAIGALAGRQIDAAIIGGGTREGPRLKELPVTTSSYGTPLARHFGRVRAAGTIIWATELAEHKTKSGGGKGRPSTTTYSYSASFAVALSSRPILSLGRIWADGNLLRGAEGDLKSAGTLRIHAGTRADLELLLRRGVEQPEVVHHEERDVQPEPGQIAIPADGAHHHHRRRRAHARQRQTTERSGDDGVFREGGGDGHRPARIAL